MQQSPDTEVKISMSRISEVFENKKAVIPFITCGDPNLDVTVEIIKEMEKAGADIIELGMPFSDPTAEGPVVMESNVRALSAGVTTDKIFMMIKNIRNDVKVPLLVSTYANVVFSYGTDRFMKTAAEAGINGIILPDIPYEEKKEFSTVSDKYGIEFISVIAPSSKDRIKMIVNDAEGMLYCATGTTREGVKNVVEAAKSVKNLPCAVGYEISTEEQAIEMAKVCDGIVMDTAIVKICEQYKEDSPKYIAEYVGKIKKAVLSVAEG